MSETTCPECGGYVPGHATGAGDICTCEPIHANVYRPHDQQWLQEMCELVRNKMPESHAFVVFAFPVKGTDRCYYASSAERDDAIAALKEWLSYQEKVKDWWMKHDDGPPPKATWPKET